MQISINFSPGLLTEITVTPATDVKLVASYLRSNNKKYDVISQRYFFRLTKVYDTYNRKTGVITVPLGLVKWLLIELLNHEIIRKEDIIVKDNRSDFDNFDLSKININDYKTLYNYSKSKEIALRDYQFEGIKALLLTNLGILNFPTSSGKGEIIVALSKILQQFGQVLVIVPTTASLISTEERLVDYGVKYFKYHKVRCLSSVDGVILSTPKVINNDVLKIQPDSLLNTIKYILTNEVHHVQAVTWYNAIKGLPSVIRSYGFSATPDVTDSKSIVSIQNMLSRDAMIRGTHGDVVMEIKSKDIEKHISVPDILNVYYKPNIVDKDDVSNFDWNYIKKYLYEPNRIKFISDLVRIINDYTNFTTITFVSTIETQGNPLFELYPPNTACWYGGGEILNNVNYSSEELNKDSIFNAIKNRKIRHTIVTSHAREDVNLPALNVAIMLDLSKRQSIKQCVGRVVRKGTPSFFVNIFDVIPTVLKNQSKKKV